MKCLAILIACVVGSVIAVPEGYGQYVPKSYYYIDESGNPTIPQPISSHTLNRVRRQQPFQPFGQGFPNFNFPQPGQGQGAFVSTSNQVHSRFGPEDDGPVVTGQSTFISTDKDGKVQQHTTYLRPDGSTYTQRGSTNTRQKRQTQQQEQSQKGPAGSQQQVQNQEGLSSNQIQSQNQQGPSGNQIQTQNQLGSNLDNINGQQLNNQQNPNSIPNSQQGQNINNHQNPNEFQSSQQGQNFNNQQNPNAIPSSQQGQNINNQPQPNPNVIPINQQQGSNVNNQVNPQPTSNFGGQQGGQPQIGFPFQGGFGFPQAGFGFPQQGFAPFPPFPNQFGPGYFPMMQGLPPVFAAPIQPGQPGTTFQGTTSTLDNRFGEDGEGTITGGTQTITSQNGNYNIHTSVLKPDGQVVHSHQSGKFPNKKKTKDGLDE